MLRSVHTLLNVYCISRRIPYIAVISYMLGTCLAEQLQALQIFLSASSGYVCVY